MKSGEIWILISTMPLTSCMNINPSISVSSILERMVPTHHGNLLGTREFLSSARPEPPMWQSRQLCCRYRHMMDTGNWKLVPLPLRPPGRKGRATKVVQALWPSQETKIPSVPPSGLIHTPQDLPLLLLGVVAPSLWARSKGEKVDAFPSFLIKVQVTQGTVSSLPRPNNSMPVNQSFLLLYSFAASLLKTH